MPTKLGFYFNTGHFPVPEMVRMAGAKCPVALFHDDVDGMMWALGKIPYVFFRSTHLSDKGDDFQRYNGHNTPKQAAEDWWWELNAWWNHNHSWKYGALPRGVYYIAWNEPAGWEWMAQFAEAEIRRMELMAAVNHRAGIFGFAAGCPPLPDHPPEDDPTGDKRLCWARLKPACEAALEYGAIVCLHAYWSPDPETWLEWLFGRHHKVREALDMPTLPIALTEIGWDMVGSSWEVCGFATPGWTTLCDWWAQHGEADCVQAAMTRLARADEIMRQDPYCLGGMFFKTGGSGHHTYEVGDQLRDAMLAHMESVKDEPDPEPEPPPEPPPSDNEEENGVDKTKILTLVLAVIAAIMALLGQLGVDFIDIQAELISTPTPLATSTGTSPATFVPTPLATNTPESTATPLSTSTPQPTATLPPQGVTLLNPGFEGGWWTKQYVEVSVPDNWDLIYLEGHSFCWNGWCARRPECKVIPKATPYLNPPRVYEGQQAYQCFTMWGQGDGALVQSVNVPADMWVRFSIWVHSWSSQADNPFVSDVIDVAPSNVKFWIGIHPQQGADPYCSPSWNPYSCGWSWKGPYWCPDEWCKLSIKKQGVGTLAWRWQTEYPFKHNDIHADGAVLEEAGG